MKKGLIIGGIILVVLIIGGIFFYPAPQEKAEDLSQEQILEIVQPLIDKHCENIIGESEQTPTCPYCRDSTIEFVKDNEIYSIEGSTRIAWGGYNNRAGEKTFSAKLSESGEVISFEMEEMACVY